MPEWDPLGQLEEFPGKPMEKSTSVSEELSQSFKTSSGLLDMRRLNDRIAGILALQCATRRFSEPMRDNCLRLWHKATVQSHPRAV